MKSNVPVPFHSARASETRVPPLQIARTRRLFGFPPGDSVFLFSNFFRISFAFHGIRGPGGKTRRQPCIVARIFGRNHRSWWHRLEIPFSQGCHESILPVFRRVARLSDDYVGVSERRMEWGLKRVWCRHAVTCFGGRLDRSAGTLGICLTIVERSIASQEARKNAGRNISEYGHSAWIVFW